MIIGEASENERRDDIPADIDTDIEIDTETEDWPAPGSLPRGVQWNLQKRLGSHLRG